MNNTNIAHSILYLHVLHSCARTHREWHVACLWSVRRSVMLAVGRAWRPRGRGRCSPRAGVMEGGEDIREGASVIGHRSILRSDVYLLLALCCSSLPVDYSELLQYS